METSSTQGPQKVPGVQLLILILSIVVLAALMIDVLFPLPGELSRLVRWLDHLACAVFFLDFCVRFKQARRKLEFMKWGWLDVLASVPNIEALRLARLVRVIRVIRMLRTVRVSYRMLSLVMRDRPGGAFSSVLLTVFLLVTFASLGTLMMEVDPGSNIRTAEDAIWWSMTTITTVGYGDHYPTTLGGRLLAMGLMLCGVGLFGTLSGLVASWFLGPQKHDRSDLVELKKQLAEVNARLDRLLTGGGGVGSGTGGTTGVGGG
jgi:voltage-gated potassium channel